MNINEQTVSRNVKIYTSKYSVLRLIYFHDIHCSKVYHVHVYMYNYRVHACRKLRTQSRAILLVVMDVHAKLVCLLGSAI